MRSIQLLCGSRLAAMLYLLSASVFSQANVEAQTPLLDEVRTVAAADQGVPIEQTFAVALAGTYQVKLTDLGKAATPSAPLATLKLAITNGSAIVGKPLTAEGTTQFTATAAGTYVLRVVGKPGSVAGSGPFGVQITNVADGSQLFGFAGTLAPPAASFSNVAVLNETFTVSASDTYTVTLTDLQFPQFLNTVQLALTTPGGGSGLLATLAIANGTPAAVQQATAALQPNTTYNIIAFGQSTAAANAGLYAVVVRNSSNAVVYSRTLPVGTLTALGTAPLVAGNNYTLRFNDLAYPAPLSTAAQGAVVTLDDQVAASVNTTGNKGFSAVNGNYQAFALGTAAAASSTPGASSPGAGSYVVDVRPTGGGTPVLSVAQAVTATGSTLQAYTFNTDVTTPGNYNVLLADYQFPQTLTSVGMIAVQAGASLASLSNVGTLPVAATVGKLSVLVFSQAPPPGGAFGLFVSPAGGASPIFETTQGVGALYVSRKVSVTSAGTYVVQVSDVGFPANFANLYVLVTQGGTLVGTILGGGSLPFTATAGDYFITFTAQPSGSDEAGTYAINVAAPPAPALTLTANDSHVASGTGTTLSWSSKNVTSCTATGGSSGWPGAKPLSGSASTGALTADTTFTLSCTAPGGPVAQSVTITIDHSSGGGGGALDVGLLAALAGLLAMRLRAQSEADRPATWKGQSG